MTRKWILPALILAIAGCWALSARHSDGARAAQRAFDSHLSGLVLTVPGAVERILADDAHPPRHQRFLLRTARGQTLLIAHNLEIARRVPIQVGDKVTVRGEYEWNEEGGLLHNTHFRGRGPCGWIRVERTRAIYR